MKLPDNRPRFATRAILLRGDSQQALAIAAIGNAPLDPVEPLEVVIREQVKSRKRTQNEAMWAGVLSDFETQAWVSGRQFTAEVWHIFFKNKYLPDEINLPFHELIDQVRDPSTYQKFDFLPNGDRVLIGSTTQLTVRGMAIYMQQIEAYGASLGVMFGAPG